MLQGVVFSYGRQLKNFLNPGSAPARRLGFGAFLVGLGLVSADFADAARLRVLGNSTFSLLNVQALGDEGLRIKGILKDERGQPIAAALVRLLDDDSRPCAQHSDVTDPEGAFCFDVPKGSDPAGEKFDSAELVFAGSDYFGPARHTLTLTPTQVSVALELKLSAPSWALAQRTHAVSLRMTSEQDFAEKFRAQLWLKRGDAKPKRLAVQPISLRDEARFEIATEQLGAPGEAELIASLDHGAHRIAEARAQVTLVGKVLLEWAGEFVQVRPDEGFETVVAVRTPHGPVGRGWVETYVGNNVVGIAKVDNGAATVLSRFSAPRRTSVAFSARYLSDAPHYIAGDPISGRLELMPPSAWKHLPWLLLLSAVAVWVVRTWRRPRSRKLPGSDNGGAHQGVAGLRVLDAGPSADGWVGSVRDAHTQELLSGVQLEIAIPRVDRGGALNATAISGADGTFALSPTSRQLPEGTRLVIRAAWHSTLTLPAPPLGAIEILLVARRRTLLQHFTRWTEQPGSPFALGPLATPGRVAERAAEKGLNQAENWARSIEEASFGPQPPDALTESRLIDLTPGTATPNRPLA